MQLDKQAGLRFYYLEGILILAGVWFYAVGPPKSDCSITLISIHVLALSVAHSLLQTHFPEIRWPGLFDIWGASHQIFHVFVVLGAVSHFYGILSAFDWNYNNPRC